MFRHIVIGFDGTDHARDAAVLAERLAKPMGASLTFVTAFYDVPNFLPDPLRAKLREEAEHTLREAALGVPDEVPASKRLVSHRSPGHALFEFVEGSDADLIVLGSSRDARRGEVRCGRLARQVVAGAPCAVAIAPASFHEDATPVRLVAVGVDGGKESRHALGAAVELARACGARLRIMAVVDRIEAVSPWGVVSPNEIDGSLRAVAEQALHDAVEAAPGDVDVETALLDDYPIAHALAGDAAAAGADALVVGSRAFGPLRRVLLGSVSSELMHRAPCPLFVVPRGARDTSDGDEEAATQDALETR